jgi:hypothetical protein
MTAALAHEFEAPMNLLQLLASILDTPEVQDPAARVVAALLRKELPDVTEKAIGDFLALVGKYVVTAPGA